MSSAILTFEPRAGPPNPGNSQFRASRNEHSRRSDTLYSTGMRRWSVVCLLSLGIVIAYIDRTNLSVSLASADFKTLFHLTDKDRGLLGSVFFWSYAVLQIPAGFVVDHFGVKRPVAIGL